MPKLDTLNVEHQLAVFTDALGSSYGKIVADTKSMLGRVTDKAITTKAGEWKPASGGKIKATDGTTVQLDLNNPATSLLLFGMKIRAIADVGEMEIQSEIPSVCRAWVNKHANAPVEA